MRIFSFFRERNQVFKLPLSFCYCVEFLEVDEILRCQYCEKDVALPFKCPFCGKYFCPEHRLPENHACTELWMVKTRPVPPIERGPTVDLSDAVEPPRQPVVMYPFRVRKERWTSKAEICHLTLGALLVTAVGLSMTGFGLSWIFKVIQNPTLMFGSAALFMLIFVSHELAHKASAKHFGMWAEFRLNLFGAALTLLSIISPLIKIISPGAVMISGLLDKRTAGKIAFAGPLMNIILASLLCFMALQIRVYPLGIMLLRGGMLSAWMAAFNLIPISILDGAKVLWWSKHAWAAGFGISIALSLVTSLL